MQLSVVYLVLSSVTLLLRDGVTAQTSQCSSALEDLRYHVYSELADSKKELDSLRTDLQYWQNTTLSILKKYLVEKDDNAGEFSCDVDAIAESLKKLNTGQSEDTCRNNTDDTVSQVREVMEEYMRTQSQELREHRRALSDELLEIISEMSSDCLPLGTFLNPAPSCKQVNGSSGNYWIQNGGTGYASLQYCDMTERCSHTGGWMRVAFLDMTNPSHHCPTGFRSITSPFRMCGRPGAGCHSTTYSVEGVAYSRVCGRIKGYQYYSPDATWAYYKNRAITIDNAYVDGVSLTHGSNPRKHIWTFVAALDEANSHPECACPCSRTSDPFLGAVPPFIGQDYFCDTGSRYRYQNRWYTADPLWDGDGCGDTSSCCEFNNPPWFCKELPLTTTGNIELRLCADNHIEEEEIGIEQVEIYVQ